MPNTGSYAGLCVGGCGWAGHLQSKEAGCSLTRLPFGRPCYQPQQRHPAKSHTSMEHKQLTQCLSGLSIPQLHQVSERSFPLGKGKSLWAAPLLRSDVKDKEAGSPNQRSSWKG